MLEATSLTNAANTDFSEHNTRLFKLGALKKAIDYMVPKVVTYFTEHPEEASSKAQITHCFNYEADIGRHENVSLFLELFGNQIPSKDKGTALKKATTKNYHDVVVTLLQHASDQISNSDKNIALCWAANHGYHEIAATILNDYVQISYKEFQSALSEGAAHPLVIQAFNNLKASVINNVKHKFNAMAPFFPTALTAFACEYVDHAFILTPEEFQQAISDSSENKSNHQGTSAATGSSPAVDMPVDPAMVPMAPLLHAPAMMAAPLLLAHPRRKRKADEELLVTEKPALRRSARLAAKAMQAQHANGKEGLTSKRSCLRSSKK